MADEDAFYASAEHLKTLIDKNAGERDLLFLYGRYKQVTVGPCNTSKPNQLNISARKKWKAWNELKDLSRKVAIEEYINKICQLDNSWDPYTNKNLKNGMGVAVSVLRCHEDETIAESDKTIFDWCKDGVLEKVEENMTKTQPKDEEGRTLLHWACDRGHLHIVQYLLNQGHDVNCRDSDMSTPLHYAAACDHIKIAKLLLEFKADRHLKDNDNETPLDCASTKISELITQHTPSPLSQN